jgi:CubicO group peptidase (beta-lactamase class C family)
VETAAKALPGGYCVEMQIPWERMSAEGKEGEELGVVVTVVDADGDGPAGWWIWKPRDGRHDQDRGLVRLSQRASPPQSVDTAGEIVKLSRINVVVGGLAELAGQKVRLMRAGQCLWEGELHETAGQAVVQATLPLPPLGQAGEPVTAVIQGQEIHVDLPDADEARARELLYTPIQFGPYCFAENVFPECDFAQWAQIEPWIGAYRIDVTYYDANFDKVTQPAKPGRYGAVIDITPANGPKMRRFRTLYRLERPVDWEWLDAEGTLTLPAELGVPAEVWARHRVEVNHLLMERLQEDTYGGTAALLAGLHEATPDIPADELDDWAGVQNRQWWVTFKRRLYGTDKVYTKPFVCPRKIEGPPALVIREGTLAEAGMKPDGIAALDALCEEWGREGQEALAVIVVRHGVIALHKAYGVRGGEPMTVDTPSWLASITKLLSSILMMELVDQGLVDVEARVDEYLPALRGVDVATPLTIRHCYNHTGGLWGHWGDWDDDFEEKMREYYPRLKVGQRYEYNGAGLAIGGKIIETISGEAIPLFYKRHLLRPLGCTGTHVSGTSADARSIPLDMAKIGQMLLNGGAYGDMRFFGKDTLRKWMPRPKTDSPVPRPVSQRSLDMGGYESKGFGADSFGRGGASESQVIISPKYDLVAVVCRNARGQEYNKYSRAFYKALVDAVETQEPATQTSATQGQP